MTRYNGKASSPSNSSNVTLEPLANVSTNIAKVRSGLTASPQTRFSVFRLSPTPYGLEIRLPTNRVRGSLIATIMKENAANDTRLTLWAVVGMAMFVGGVVALTGSAVFGAVIAVLLPAILWLITLSEKITSGGYATLRLVNAPNGQTFLSMSAVSGPAHTKISIAERDAANERLFSPYTYSSDTPKAKPVIYFSNRSVKRVSARTGISGGELSFTVYTETAREGNCLRVTGSQQEVRWLHTRVAQWGKGRQSNQA